MNILLINFLAALSQTVAGFGAPLISMPFLIEWLGLEIATPLSTLVGLITSLALLAYYRTHLNFRAVRNLILSALPGVPVGAFYLTRVDIGVVNLLLAVVLIGYSLYSLFLPSPPRLKGAYWEYVFGFAAGVMGGAFNISGPIVVMYAAFRHWRPEEFRSNVQGFFTVTNTMIMVSYWSKGTLDLVYWRAFAWAFPGMLLAIVLGIYISRRIDTVRFRQLVIVLLLISGVYLLV